MATKYSFDVTLPYELDPEPFNSERPRASMLNASHMFRALAHGAYPGDSTVITAAETVAASATVTFSSIANGMVVEVNGVPFTALTGSTSYTANNEFALGASDAAAATNFISVFNASTSTGIADVLTASSGGSGIVTITCDHSGQPGNGITVRTLGVVASGSIACGTDAATTNAVDADDAVTVNGVTFTAKASPSGELQFLAAATNALTAIALAAKINACTNALVSGHVRAFVDGAEPWKVKVKAKIPGPAGNAVSLTTTDATDLAVSGARLTGGTEASSNGARATGTVTITGADGGNYTVLVNGVTTGNVAGTNGDDNATAASVAAAMQGITTALFQEHVLVSVATNVITVTARQGGLAGNAITLSCTGTGAVASVAQLAGGAAPTTVVPSAARLASGSATYTTFSR